MVRKLSRTASVALDRDWDALVKSDVGRFSPISPAHQYEKIAVPGGIAAKSSPWLRDCDGQDRYVVPEVLLASPGNDFLDQGFDGVLQAECLAVGNCVEQPLIAELLILGVHLLGQAVRMEIQAIATLQIDYRLVEFCLINHANSEAHHVEAFGGASLADQDRRDGRQL